VPHRGVYAVGHPDPPGDGRFLAAVLARGPTAVLSHLSAAAVHGFFTWTTAFPEVTALIYRHHGAAWHDNRLAREDDAEGQALLEAHGELVLRVTWRQAVSARTSTLARLRTAGAPRLDDS
jgi:hypothetical protein